MATKPKTYQEAVGRQAGLTAQELIAEACARFLTAQQLGYGGVTLTIAEADAVFAQLRVPGGDL